MSNLGPLTKTFTPPTSCAPTNAFSQIDGGFLFHLVQGAVETQGCYPDKFNPSNQDYYSPAVCPAGYTAACSGVTSSGTATETVQTCCPTFGLSSGSFSCRQTIHTQFPWESSLACQYAITTAVTLAPLTSVGKGKTTTVSSSAYRGGAIGAYGVVVRNQRSDSAKLTSAEAPANTGSSTSSSSPKETGNNSPGGGSGGGHGLSSGAAAGIGVGCALAAVFVVAGGFLLWRRRSRQKKHSERPEDFGKAELAPEGDGQTTSASSPFDAAGKSALHTPTPPYSETMLSQTPQELPATIPRQELPSNEAH